MRGWTDIWRFCRFNGALFQALCALPGGIVDLSLTISVLITAGCGTLVGRSVAMVSLLGRESLPRMDS